MHGLTTSFLLVPVVGRHVRDGHRGNLRLEGVGPSFIRSSISFSLLVSLKFFVMVVRDSMWTFINGVGRSVAYIEPIWGGSGGYVCCLGSWSSSANARPPSLPSFVRHGLGLGENPARLGWRALWCDEAGLRQSMTKAGHIASFFEIV